MNYPFKILIAALVVVYLCITFLSVWKLYSPRINDVYYHEKHGLPSFSEHRKNFKKQLPHSIILNQVEVWGKAAIGLYFWTHIINGRLNPSKNSLVNTGNITLESTALTFRSGPGVIQTTVPFNVEHLVLVLNGRSKDKVAAAIQWLEYLPHYKRLKNVAIILLGNEECNNSWIWPYMKSRGGKIDIAFLVYDSPIIDNDELYQWPLGVATYHGFPNIKPHHVDVKSRRPYICNFLGTLYENSSRVLLTSIIRSSGFYNKCIIKPRMKWLPLETSDTFNSYIYALSNSDLTLSPVGKNTECYRIYEAMSLGSTPVIEDVVTPGFCDTSYKSPLRLLKKYKAPVIYIKNWNELPELLQAESHLSETDKVKRRKTIVKWYEQFKSIMRDQFIKIIERKFFVK